jgi:hypothetical protein
VLVMPYDSATGSIPIVRADINDFRDRAAEDDMAVKFYKIGDAAGLARQLIAIPESTELQRSMGEHNFATKRALRNGTLTGRRRLWNRFLFTS